MHPPPAFPSIPLSSYHYAAVMHWLRGQLALYKGAAVKLLWEIADRTFGHRKWEDVIALSQFAHACGLGRDTVLATLSDLLQVGIIRRRPVGNSYVYCLAIPQELFSERPEQPVENRDGVLHSESDPFSFFAQNPDTSPQTEAGQAGFSSLQTENVTELETRGNQWSEILTALSALNEALPSATYALRNLPRWATRAVRLGMHWGDVWTLWCACRRVGRKPLALFLHRLLADGSLPTGTSPKVRDATKQRFAAMLE